MKDLAYIFIFFLALLPYRLSAQESDIEGVLTRLKPIESGMKGYGSLSDVNYNLRIRDSLLSNLNNSNSHFFKPILKAGLIEISIAENKINGQGHLRPEFFYRAGRIQLYAEDSVAADIYFEKSRKKGYQDAFIDSMTQITNRIKAYIPDTNSVVSIIADSASGPYVKSTSNIREIQPDLKARFQGKYWSHYFKNEDKSLIIRYVKRGKPRKRCNMPIREIVYTYDDNLKLISKRVLIRTCSSEGGIYFPIPGEIKKDKTRYYKQKPTKPKLH
ncbi:MAG: hypothetical protein ACI8XB_002880 [Patiriisocius sp.]|jgi:hypothetical protein